MTTKNGNGGLRLALLVIGTAATVASASWALMASKVDDRCDVLRETISSVRGDVDRDAERIDALQTEIKATREQLVRMEGKLDELRALLMREPR